jgi:hypothetical protein
MPKLKNEPAYDKLKKSKQKVVPRLELRSPEISKASLSESDVITNYTIQPAKIVSQSDQL